MNETFRSLKNEFFVSSKSVNYYRKTNQFKGPYIFGHYNNPFGMLNPMETIKPKKKEKEKKDTKYMGETVIRIKPGLSYSELLEQKKIPIMEKEIFDGLKELTIEEIDGYIKESKKLYKEYKDECEILNEKFMMNYEKKRKEEMKIVQEQYQNGVVFYEYCNKMFNERKEMLKSFERIKNGEKVDCEVIMKDKKAKFTKLIRNGYDVLEIVFGYLTIDEAYGILSFVCWNFYYFIRKRTLINLRLPMNKTSFRTNINGKNYSNQLISSHDKLKKKNINILKSITLVGSLFVKSSFFLKVFEQQRMIDKKALKMFVEIVSLNKKRINKIEIENNINLPRFELADLVGINEMLLSITKEETFLCMFLYQDPLLHSLMLCCKSLRVLKVPCLPYLKSLNSEQKNSLNFSNLRVLECKVLPLNDIRTYFKSMENLTTLVFDFFLTFASYAEEKNDIIASERIDEILEMILLRIKTLKHLCFSADDVLLNQAGLSKPKPPTRYDSDEDEYYDGDDDGEYLDELENYEKKISCMFKIYWYMINGLINRSVKLESLGLLLVFQPKNEQIYKKLVKMMLDQENLSINFENALFKEMSMSIHYETVMMFKNNEDYLNNLVYDIAINRQNIDGSSRLNELTLKTFGNRFVFLTNSTLLSSRIKKMKFSSYKCLNLGFSTSNVLIRNYLYPINVENIEVSCNASNIMMNIDFLNVVKMLCCNSTLKGIILKNIIVGKLYTTFIDTKSKESTSIIEPIKEERFLYKNREVVINFKRLFSNNIFKYIRESHYLENVDVEINVILPKGTVRSDGMFLKSSSSYAENIVFGQEFLKCFNEFLQNLQKNIKSIVISSVISYSSDLFNDSHSFPGSLILGNLKLNDNDTDKEPINTLNSPLLIKMLNLLSKSNLERLIIQGSDYQNRIFQVLREKKTSNDDINNSSVTSSNKHRRIK